MTDRTFQTSSEHSTSLGRVRYQHCVCGRFRVLRDSDVLSNPDVWQPAEVNTATYARFGMAMIDHDTDAALGV